MRFIFEGASNRIKEKGGSMTCRTARHSDVAASLNGYSGKDVNQIPPSPSKHNPTRAAPNLTRLCPIECCSSFWSGSDWLLIPHPNEPPTLAAVTWRKNQWWQP